MQHSTRVVLAAVIAAVLSLIAAPVAAETKIAVLVEGPKAETFRDIVLETVPPGIEVMNENAFRSALARRGLPGGKMGFALSSDKMKKTLLGIVQRTVKGENLGVAILGRARAGRGGLELVLVAQGPDGDPMLDEAVPLKGNRDAQKAAVAGALAPVYESLGAAAPEPEPEPEPEAVEEKPEPEEPKEGEEEEEEEEEEDDDGEEFEENRPGHELFNIYAGADFNGRFFGYSESEANTNNLRPYDVFGVPALHVAGEIYPMATLDIVVLSDIGLTVSYMHAFGLDSQTEDALYLFGTNWNRFSAGLRYRQRVAEVDGQAVYLGLNGNFGFLNFTFDPESPQAPQIVNEIGTVNYLTLRVGIDARIPAVSWFALAPSFGFVAPLNSGETEPAACQDPDGAGPQPAPECQVYERFRDPSVYGVDMGLTFVFVLPLGFETRAGIEYTRFFSSFSPEPGDSYVAGGALDQFLALRVGIAYVF